MLEEQLNTELAKRHLSLREFSELIIRLLDYGIISRSESNIEASLYDRYLSCSEIVEEYLSIIHVRLFHDHQFSYIRAYPPGADIPGLADDEHAAFNSGLRYRPTQLEVSVILILRVEYEKALREGLVNDEGCVMIAFESLVFAMKNLLNRSLPENASERKQVFKRLKQLRLIQFSSDDEIDNDESWLSIQPSISSFVNHEALAALYPEKTEQDDNSESHTVNEEP